jgi:hypothetical protein
MFMKLMKQKKEKIFFLLCEHITPTSFLYIYILITAIGNNTLTTRTFLFSLPS